MAAEGNKMTTIYIGIDIGWIYQHAKFYDIPFKRFVSKRGETSKCGEQTNGRTIIPISLNGSRISPKWFDHSSQTQAHVQLDGRMNTWNGNNTISINDGRWWDIWTSACQILCHFSKWFVSETAWLNRCYKTVEIKWSMSYPCLMIPIMGSSIRFELKLISCLPANAPRPERVTNRQTGRRMY